MTFLAWEYGNQQCRELPSLSARTKNAKKAWESVNKLGAGWQCKRGKQGREGGSVQGDRSVNHQWLRFILPPLSKSFKGGFVYLLHRQELEIWGTGNQDTQPPPSPPHTSPIPLPLCTHLPSNVRTHRTFPPFASSYCFPE